MKKLCKYLSFSLLNSDFFRKNSSGLLLLLILFLGVFLRFYKIVEIPCGLFPDQAINGLDAYKFSGGLLSPVYGNQEGLYIYLTAISQWLFGHGVWQIFIVSAFLGSLTVFTTYLAVKEIFDRNLAFLSSFILAVSGWHIALSRSGFRVILVPLIVSCLAYFIARAIKVSEQRKKKIYALLAAIIFALGFYTYNAYVIFALACFIVVIYLFLAYRENFLKIFRANRESIQLAFLFFILVIFPIALFVIIFPDRYFARSDQVSVFAQTGNFLDALNLIWSNFLQTFRGLFYLGDFNPRHNPVAEPLLNFLLIPFFFLGLFHALFKSGSFVEKLPYRLLFFFFFMMFLPAILTAEGLPPHALRLVGIIPFVFIFSAIGLNFLLNFKTKILRTMLISVLFLVLGFTATYGYLNYFNSANSQHYYTAFRCDLTEVAHYIKKDPAAVIVIDDFSLQTLRYLFHGEKINTYNAQNFVKNFDDKILNGKSLILASDNGQFDDVVLDLLAKNYKKKEKRNVFGNIDYFIFDRIVLKEKVYCEDCYLKVVY